MLDISPFITLIQLKYFLRGIQHCLTVVSKWIFDSNVPFALPLTRDNLDYFCTNNNKTKVMNDYKEVLKPTKISQQRKICVSFRSLKIINYVWCYKYDKAENIVS